MNLTEVVHQVWWSGFTKHDRYYHWYDWKHDLHYRGGGGNSNAADHWQFPISGFPSSLWHSQSRDGQRTTEMSSKQSENNNMFSNKEAKDYRLGGGAKIGITRFG
jgi:hypothetical protein